MLLPPDLEELIGANHPVRIVNDNALKVPTDRLIEALVADKLIEKDNFSFLYSKAS